jgi:hypothetical protein
MKTHSLASSTLSLCGGLAALAFGQLDPAPGFSASGVILNHGGAFIGGMCALPDGRAALFDGQSVIAIDVASQQQSVLHTPSGFVFGSFLVVEPGGAAIYFGESTAGSVTRIALSTGATNTIATVPLAYDAAFSAAGDLFVSRGNSTWSATEIVRVDLASGAVDVIANAPGPSGPLAFDGDGNLYYGENSSFFPAPVGSGKIWKWDAIQVGSANGTSQLSTSNAALFAAGLDGISDLAFDAEGDLAVSDSARGRLYALSPAGVVRSMIAEVNPGGITYLAFRDDSTGSVARFDPFQPEAGGELLAIDSDYSTYSALSRIRPRRASFETTPASPLATGPFALTLNDGAPFALMYLFAATNSMPEIPVFATGMPLFFGLAPGSILPLPPVSLTSNGAFALAASHPGIAVTVHLQAVLLDAFVGPLGTTPVATLTFQ